MRVWDVGTGERADQRMSLSATGGAGLHNAVFSPNGRFILAAASNGEARLWDISAHLCRTGSQPCNQGASDVPYRLLLSEKAAVRRAVFSQKGDKILTVSDDGTGIVWQTDTLKSQPLDKHDGVLRYGAFSPNGSWVVTASTDSTARVLSADDGHVRATLRGHTSALTMAVFSPDSRYVVTASEDGTAHIWDREWQPPTATPPPVPTQSP